MAVIPVIGCVVPDVRVADPETNAQQICAYIRRGADAGCSLMVFPRLALTGYSCGDLFRERCLLDAAREALETVTAFSGSCPGLSVVLGAPVEKDGKLYNCAVILRDGVCREQIPLTDINGRESRWFTPGKAESVWVENVCIYLDAAPALMGSRRRTAENLRRKSSQTEGVFLSLSPGCWESNQDVLYSGHSLVAQNGCLLKENAEAVRSGYLMICQESDMAEKNGLPQESPGKRLSAYPFVPEDPALCLEAFQIQAAGLARRLRQLNCRPVIGVSGGLDSTLALLVAVEAVSMLGREASDVCALTMPCFGTSDRTYENAKALMTLLGVTQKEVDIRQAVTAHFADIGHDISFRNATYENAQARERTQVLMDYAGMVGGIVVGTGDLSELALGWCTYNGDHMSMYGVNASIPKTLIPYIIRAAAELPAFKKAAAVLEDVIQTPISPELLPPDAHGELTQHTEDVVGPYALHDFFLYYMLTDHFAPQKIYDLACQAFAEVYTGETIRKWIKVFYRRFFTQQFKRSCQPEGVQVTEVSLSPRTGYQIPSDAEMNLWLNILQAL